MTIDELLQDRRIQRQKVAAVDIKALLSRAKTDIESARFMLPRDSVWAFSIAYNAVLQATRALMFSHGFRPSSHEGHKNAFAYLRASVEEERRSLVDYFDTVRVKRHHAVYEAPGRVTRTEAETLIKQAESFVAWVEARVKA